MKPRVFVASSSEGLPIAYAIQENLSYDAEVIVWTQDIFRVSSNILEGLMEASSKVDFAVFAFSSDDLIRSRDRQAFASRDNIIFELGLFIGKLGRERIFLVLPRGQQGFDLPTDLVGITTATFEPHKEDENLHAALGPASLRIRKAIRHLGLTGR